MRYCPKCQTTMESEIVRVVELERCPDCHGMLLDRGELGLLVKRRIDADASPAEIKRADTSPATCFDCARPMTAETVNGVRVDVCGRCGVVFLDSGELDRIQGRRR